jgi:pimeloyl-ACP methyl ester carboxylesterase
MRWKNVDVPKFERSEISINYEVSGSGPRVLFFNGSGATLKSTALLIGALAKTCTVLAHDQRGLGETSIPDGPYTMAQYAHDGAALLDHVGWDTCAVVGISFGGMVAQEFAVSYPQRVEKLVLLCTSAGGDAGSSYPLHELGTLPADERAARITTLTDTRFTPEWLATHPDDAAMVAMRNEQAAVPKSKDTIKGEMLQLGARIGHDVSDRLHRVSAPVFVTAGRFDGIAPVSNSEEIVKRLPNATLSIYEGGHIFTAQDRQAIVDIRTFLTTGQRP